MMNFGSLLAHTSGPSQPEFSSFTPIGSSDMVDLASGNFNYNIPVMDVGGYPLNLSYDSGVTMDQEASWVGLGWNLNVGHIDRQVRGIPDDFKGDKIRYENDFKTNRTVGATFGVTAGVFGQEGLTEGAADSIVTGSLGLTATYNNYEGVTFQLQQGLGLALSDNIQVGYDLSSSVSQGATVSPKLSISGKLGESDNALLGEASFGLVHNSREGIRNLMLQTALGKEKNQMSRIGGLNFDFNDPTHTPFKRAGVENSNFSFSAALGVTFIGFDGFARIDGFGSYQKIRDNEKDKSLPSYGYENTEAASGEQNILDFNRENDKTFNKHTTVVPLTNYTYDVYSVNSQGLNGSFRPFKSQTGYVSDPEVYDNGDGVSVGARFGGGNLAFGGGDFEISNSYSRTGLWKNNNNALGKFEPVNKNTTDPLYEATYYKFSDEKNIDKEENTLFQSQLHGSDAMRLPVEGSSKYNRKLSAAFEVADTNTVQADDYFRKTINQPNLRRQERVLRQRSIYPVTNEEAAEDPFVHYRSESYVKGHHNVGMKVLKGDGSQYIFGKSTYNLKKVEGTFDVSGATNIDCQTGIVDNIESKHGKSSRFSDEYLNRITTPAYAHSYLLSSVLSSDYEDVDNNGPSLNDLGSYTKFNYRNYYNSENPYRWRLPFENDEVFYNEGLQSRSDDEKGNYLYGEKELTYIETIETKSHVAYFELENREDARGAFGEFETNSSAYSKKIKRIYLFSLPEYETVRQELEDAFPSNDPSYSELAKKAIKVAHFDYDYSLCQGVPGNLQGGGKLTLKKVYFTYRGSHMGKYTPYEFNYDSLNPSYNPKSFDVWGNFKPISEDLVSLDAEGNVQLASSTGDFCSVSSPLTSTEFPYTQQGSSEIQNQFASAWTLTSIDLPSGGHMSLEYESDDYRYVQDQKAMQMFKVVGSGDEMLPSNLNSANTLYSGRDHHKYIYVKLKDQAVSSGEVSSLKSSFFEKYLNGNYRDPIQFRFLLNMVQESSEQYDYVSGYFKLDDLSDIEVFTNSDGTYVSLPLEFLDNEGGIIKSSYKVNPIAKAGWYFGRTKLSREVFSLDGKSNSDDFEGIVKNLVGALPAVFEIFSGPNTRLQQKESSRVFNPKKSWVRLYHPDNKLGGGIRVKKVQIYDNWDKMSGHSGNELYLQKYGQEYDYTTKDGQSSGVAAFEPMSSRENPFIQPFYDAEGKSAKDRLVAPREMNYTEKPFGKSFFPGARVTYSKVSVSNLSRTRRDSEGNVIASLGSHATGQIEHEFYTTRDFPTKVDYTGLDKEFDSRNVLGDLLNLRVKDRNHLTLSQGFSIETNDMNGKPKSQMVYAEDKNTPISGVRYHYSLDENNEIETHLPAIATNGEVTREFAS